MELSKENVRLLPLVAIGLAKAVGEIIVKPMLTHPIEEARDIKAAIHHHRTK